MTLALRQLVADAERLAGADPCHGGALCKWDSEGGRPCPEGYRDDCGQAAYRCLACGAYDYGEPGGPGAADCAAQCPGPDDYWHEARDFGPPLPGRDLPAYP